MERGSSFEGFRIDLVQAARNELSFLRLVDECPSLNTAPVIQNAIKRYEAYWLPLAFQEQVRDKSEENEGSCLIAAPLDIAWVWHVHMLAPYYYEQDCISIVSTLIDHRLLSYDQKKVGLERAQRKWEELYPSEPFNFDLSRPPPDVTGGASRIKYNIEDACYRQSKFLYQVSLPHYNDETFLRAAVERYEQHLRLKKQHPEVFMVPCYDVDLIWHAHQLHPLDYKQTTTELLGRTLHHDDEVTDRNPGSKLYDSEMKTRAVWEAAGLPFAKPGAMYRGNPPAPLPPKGEWHYAPLACSEYMVKIKKIEAEGLDAKKHYGICLRDTKNKKIFLQYFKGNNRVKNARLQSFKFDNESGFNLKALLYKRKKLFFKSLVAATEVNLLPYFQATPFDDTVPRRPVSVEVPFNEGQYMAKVTVEISTPIIIKYDFMVEPEKNFTACNHPSEVLNFPRLMLSPSDLAEPFLPCESSTHAVRAFNENEVFKCRVIHSASAILSAVEIISLNDGVVATAHTISPSLLPERSAIKDIAKTISLDQTEGERAMLIRGENDWAICIGKWQQELVQGRRQTKKHHFVKIRIFKLSGGVRSWCAVRKSKGGLFLIKIDSDTTVRLDLKQSKIAISPGAQDIPEILALAFSVSILYLLCMPYRPKLSHESAPASHQSSSVEVSPIFFLAGYYSNTVPTNVYLRSRLGCDFHDVEEDDDNDPFYPCYDFDDDLTCDVNEGPGCEGDDCTTFEGDGGGADGGACVGGDDGGG